MTKDWYPEINRGTCNECGRYIEKCTHGIYSTGNPHKPEVVCPDGCFLTKKTFIFYRKIRKILYRERI